MVSVFIHRIFSSKKLGKNEKQYDENYYQFDDVQQTTPEGDRLEIVTIKHDKCVPLSPRYATRHYCLNVILGRLSDADVPDPLFMIFKRHQNPAVWHDKVKAIAVITAA